MSNKLFASYNNYVHYTIGMPPSKVNPSNIYSVWQKINNLGLKFLKGVSSAKWGSCKNSKGKCKICQGYEQKYLLSRLSSPCLNLFTYFHTCRLFLSKTIFTITCLSTSLYPQTQFQIDKIVLTVTKSLFNILSS